VDGPGSLAPPYDAYPGWGVNGALLEDPLAAGSFFAAYPFTGVGDADGRVFRDGVLDDTPVYGEVAATPTWGAYLVEFNGTIYAAWGAAKGTVNGTEAIRKRSGVGSWANLTLPVTAPGHWRAIGSPRVFQGDLIVSGTYANPLAGGNEAFYLVVDSADVVTLGFFTDALIVDPDGSIPANTVPVNNAIFDNRFFFLYSDIADAVPAGTLLGMYDGTTWDAIHWDCTIDAAPQVVLGMRVIGGALWAVSYDGDLSGDIIFENPLDNFWIIRSNGTDVTTWVKVKQIVSTSLPLSDLVGRAD
jgi:hypothetical protein